MKVRGIRHMLLWHAFVQRNHTRSLLKRTFGHSAAGLLAPNGWRALVRGQHSGRAQPSLEVKAARAADWLLLAALLLLRPGQHQLWCAGLLRREEHL